MWAGPSTCSLVLRPVVLGGQTRFLVGQGGSTSSCFSSGALRPAFLAERTRWRGLCSCPSHGASLRYPPPRLCSARLDQLFRAGITSNERNERISSPARPGTCTAAPGRTRADAEPGVDDDRPLGLVGKAKAGSSLLTWTAWVQFPPFPQRSLPALLMSSVN